MQLGVAVPHTLHHDFMLEPDGPNGTLAGDLVMRQEMHRINTVQGTLTGDEIIAHVIASHSTHLPSAQTVTFSIPNPSVRNCCSH